MKNKRQILIFSVGVLSGFALTFLGGILFLRYNLIREAETNMEFEQLVRLVPDAVKSEDGWTVTREQCQLPKTVDGSPLAVFKLCNGEYAREMLDAESDRKIAAAIPCSMAIYKKKNGKTYLAKMNMPLLGRLLGGTPAELFSGKISDDQKRIMARISAKKVEKTK